MNNAGGPLTGTSGVVLFVAAGVCLALQLVGMSIIPVDHEFAWARRGIFLVTTLVVFAFAFRFRYLLGAWLVAVGIALNLLPIIAHGGLMPIAWETVRDSGYFPEITEDQVGSEMPGSKDILLMRDDIRFAALSDRFPVDAPLNAPNIYSLGDFVLFAGLAVAAMEILAWVVVGVLPSAPLIARLRASS